MLEADVMSLIGRFIWWNVSEEEDGYIERLSVYKRCSSRGMFSPGEQRRPSWEGNQWTMM